MYNYYNSYPNPYLADMYIPYDAYLYPSPMYTSSFCNHFTDESQSSSRHNLEQPTKNYGLIQLKDYGSEPFVVNIDEMTKINSTYRTALWTGKHLQLTLMSIMVGEDIGLEIHPNTDQFIRIEEGQGIVKMGNSKCNLDFQRKVYDDFAIIIPAGKWHNIINTGNKPLKLYSIYAPPEHPHGTVHETKAIAEAAEETHHMTM
ncbi:cupin [Clostridium haemolyticum]|uniref:cupin domain-containing protein n=1 Tax=Clostridium haemolyticum TaxID=84025 RepID=UPI0009CF26CE|nr:cupin domain-containing protein [Clostridium haemolyticum]OOB76046.1 cupin [Clostridium haemolyticum]